jgi:hypothetical protein
MKNQIFPSTIAIFIAILTGCNKNTADLAASILLPSSEGNIEYEVLGKKREPSVFDRNDIGFCANLYVKNSDNKDFQFNVFAIQALDDTGISVTLSLAHQPKPMFDGNIKLAPTEQHRGWLCFSEPEPNWTPTSIKFNEVFESDPFLKVAI